MYVDYRRSRQPGTLSQRARPKGGQRRIPIRLLIGLAIAAFSVISFLATKQTNPVTGEDQHIGITKEQEIALGLQAAPEMAAQFGGLERDDQAQQVVDLIGEHLVNNSMADQTEYPFDFNLLADDETVNAFALPGGPIFITDALMTRLETEGQLAGVLAHEIGHVIARHSAERIAQQQLTEGLTGAWVLATYDPSNPSTRQQAQMAQMVANMIQMKYGREDELQSDDLGVKIMADAGYDPRSLIRVMEILAEASGGAQQPEFASTHPSPDNRIAQIQDAIEEEFPDGVPDDLIK